MLRRHQALQWTNFDRVRDQPGLPAAEVKFWMYNTAFASISSNRNRGSFDSEELGGKERRENWEARLFIISWPPYCLSGEFLYFILHHVVNFQFKCQPWKQHDYCVLKVVGFVGFDFDDYSCRLRCRIYKSAKCNYLFIWTVQNYLITPSFILFPEKDISLHNSGQTVGRITFVTYSFVNFVFS